MRKIIKQFGKKNPGKIFIPDILSTGDIVDLFTILYLKHLKKVDVCAQVRLGKLASLILSYCPEGKGKTYYGYILKLFNINSTMWDLENRIRSTDMTDSARGKLVFKNRKANSLRVEYKNKLNLLCGHLPERKDYGGADKL